MSDSGFFDTPNIPIKDILFAPELIHESEGGWSQIYLVDRDGRFRVYKALKQDFRGDIKYETLLRKEYEIGYKMSHPCLCEVYGFLDVEGLGRVIEMEWVDGMNLSSFLSNVKPSRSLSRNLILQLCDAIEYCHSKRIIHRDIKPENIMITHSGNRLKLIDFGLSDSDSHSIFKSACGTTSYAAPEIVAGAASDERSDIYSLGKVISLLHPSFAGIARKCMKSAMDARYRDIASVRSAVVHIGRDRALRAVAAVAVFIAIALFSLPWLRGVNEEVVSEPAAANADSTVVLAPELVPEPMVETIVKPAHTPTVNPQMSPSQNPIPNQQKSDAESSDTIDVKMIDQLFEMATRMLENGE